MDRKIMEVVSSFVASAGLAPGGTADDVFDAWYNEAKHYASGAVSQESVSNATVVALRALASRSSALGHTHSGTHSLDDAADGAMSDTLGALARILRIFVIKPKFSGLLGGDASLPTDAEARVSVCVPLREAIARTVVPFLLSVSLRVPITSDTSLRCSALGALCDVLRIHPSSPLLLGACDRVAAAAADVSLDLMLREALGRVLVEAYAASPSAPAVLSSAQTLLARARDSCAMSVIWRMDASNRPELVDALRARVRAARRAVGHVGGAAPEASAAGLDVPRRGRMSDSEGVALRVFVTPAPDEDARVSLTPLPVTYCPPSEFERLVCDTLHEAIMNSRSSHDDESRRLHPRVATAAACGILTECDPFQAQHGHDVTLCLPGVPVNESGEVLERPDEWLACCRAVIEQAADDKASYRVLCHYPTPASLTELISVVSLPNEATWLEVLVPFLERLVWHMKIHVTGSQEDQEVISTIRDGLRVWYMQSRREPSPMLGRALFQLALSAIAHGYGDTERFPELAARAIRHHAVHGSAAWLEDALQERVCTQSSALRCVTDMLMSLIGLEGGSSVYGIEEVAGSADVQSSPDFVRSVLQAVAAVRTAPADAFWRELADTHPSVVQQHGAAVETLCAAVAEQLDAVYAVDGGVGIAPRSLVTALASIASCVDSRVAPSVFTHLSRCLMLLERAHASALAVNFARNSRTDPVTTEEHYRAERAVIHDALGLAARMVSVPEALRTRLATPLVNELPLHPEHIVQALTHGTPSLRRTLAAIVPLMCLIDLDADVRIEALRALSVRLRRSLPVSNDSPHTAVLPAVLPPESVMPFGCAVAVMRATPVDDSVSDEQLAHVCRSNMRVSDALSLAENTVALERDASGQLRPVNLPLSSSSRGATASRATVMMPLRDAPLTEASLLRVAAPVIAHAAVSAVASIRGGADPCSTDDARNMQLCVAIVAAAVGRLLRGVRSNIENDPHGKPDAELLHAVTVVAVGVPVEVLMQYLLSPVGLARLHVLARLSPAWAVLERSLVDTARISWSGSASTPPTRTLPAAFHSASLPPPYSGATAPPVTDDTAKVTVAATPVPTTVTAEESARTSWWQSVVTPSRGYSRIASEEPLDVPAVDHSQVEVELAAIRSQLSFRVADDPVEEVPPTAHTMAAPATSRDEQPLPHSFMSESVIVPASHAALLHTRSPIVFADASDARARATPLVAATSVSSSNQRTVSAAPAIHALPRTAEVDQHVSAAVVDEARPPAPAADVDLLLLSAPSTPATPVGPLGQQMNPGARALVIN